MTMTNDEDQPSGIATYAQRLKNLPPADKPAPQAPGLGLSGIGNEGRTTRVSIDSNPPKLGLPQWNGVGGKGYDIAKTSEQGISKITGNGLSSPLYTNLSNANQAADGLKQQTIGAGLPGYGSAAQTAAQGITSTPFSAVNASGQGIAAGMPEGLVRHAKANAVTQQLIDAQPQGGIGILPDQAERDNADMQRMRMNSRIDDLMSGIKYGKRSERSASAAALGVLTGADTQRAVEGMRQQGIAAGLDLQRRGQDIGQAAEAAKLGLTLRGQDLQANTAREQIYGHERVAEIQSNAAKRLTLPQVRENLEIEAARQRIAGMDPAEIKRRTANYTETGRENPDFDPTLAKAQSLAQRRLYGDDPGFEARQQQPAKSDDAQSRFKADKAMAGHTLGKQTERGTEVFDASGRLIGHYN
jgi:hypothetical protein